MENIEYRRIAIFFTGIHKAFVYVAYGCRESSNPKGTVHRVCALRWDNDFHLPISERSHYFPTQNVFCLPALSCGFCMCFGVFLSVYSMYSEKHKRKGGVMCRSRISNRLVAPHYTSQPCEPARRRKHLYKLSKYERPFVSLFSGLPLWYLDICAHANLYIYI